MLIIRIIGIAWMLAMFFLCFRSVVSLANSGKDPFAMLMAGATVWLIIGFGPIAIIKFGWSYIR